MAAIVLRLRRLHHQRHRHCLARLYSSDNPSDSDPDPAAKLYADIKARLRQSPPRRPQAVPPPPPSSRPPIPQRPSKAASLDEIRKQLSEFRSRTAPPNPPPSPSPPPFSFSEIYKNSVPGPPGDGPDPRFSFDVIRESLRNIRKHTDAGDAVKRASPPSPTLSPESLQALKDGLKLPQPNVAGPVKDSIFQTKPADSSYRMDYLKIYSHKELGEKLRQLRPQGAGKDKKDWFSLAELNERLKKVKAMDEEKYEKRPFGVSFQDLRECLIMMKETDNKKNEANLIQRNSILNSILGDDTPDYMSLPPKEHLVEKYFHPDNMSSAEKLKLELKRVRDEFKMSETDCGSTRVQIAQLTTKIKHLSTVLHKKDKHSRKGIQDMVQRRKKLLKYLRRTDWDSYSLVLSKLGLRDNPDYKN